MKTYYGKVYPDDSVAADIQEVLQPFLLSITKMVWSKEFPQDIGSLALEIQGVPPEIMDGLRARFPVGMVGCELHATDPEREAELERQYQEFVKPMDVG